MERGSNLKDSLTGKLERSRSSCAAKHDLLVRPQDTSRTTTFGQSAEQAGGEMDQAMRAG